MGPHTAAEKYSRRRYRLKRLISNTHRKPAINVGNHNADLILTAEDEQINEPKMSSCLGTGKHNLITHMWEQIFAPTNKKHARRCKRGNFQKLKGIISKN